MDLETIARELKGLASRDRLSPSELDRVKYLMVELKRAGMSNPEMVELTGGRWSESTVRGYTTGIRSADPAPWESAAAQLSEMLSRNLTLDSVKQALDITTKLEAMGSSLDEVVSFVQDLKERGTTLSQLTEAVKLDSQLQRMGTSPSEIAGFVQELKQENIDAPAFVSLFRSWHKVGLTPGDAQSALSYKAQLEDAGFDIEVLFEIAEAAGKFGSPREVLEAVAKYGNLGQLDQELQTKREALGTLASEIESRRQELDAAGERLEGLQKETVAVEEALATYRRLEAIGFDEKALQELAKATDKYGGPRKVLAGVNSFGDFSGIKAASEEMQGKLQQQRTTLKELEERHSHLKSAIEMCQKLLQDHKFGLDAITSILATAKIYGDPIKVLKAVESYGKRKAMDEEARQLEARIEQLKKTESQYESRNKVILGQFEELNVKALEVGRTLGSVEEQLKGDTMARDILLLLRNPSSASYEDHLPLVIVLLRSITTWAMMNKSKFRFPSLIDKNLQEVLGSLGGS